MELKVSKRDVVGKKLWAYRKTWTIPWVIYGKHISSPIQVFFTKNEFLKVYKEAWASTVVNLTWDYKEMVLIHDYQVDFVKDTLNHVDFLAVKANEEVTAEVKIVLTWESQLEKMWEWRVQLIKDFVVVSAFPQDLPRDIKVDISSINSLDDGIFVKDLDLWSKIKIVDDSSLVLVAAVENDNTSEADTKSTEAVSE